MFVSSRSNPPLRPRGKCLCCQSMDNQILTFGASDRFKPNRKKIFKGEWRDEEGFSSHRQHLLTTLPPSPQATSCPATRARSTSRPTAHTSSPATRTATASSGTGRRGGLSRSWGGREGGGGEVEGHLLTHPLVFLSHRKLRAHDKVCVGVAWNPNEVSKLATCGWDGLIKYWSA